MADVGSNPATATIFININMNEWPKTFPGILPGQQNPLHENVDFWKYGIIENGQKLIDPFLHYSSFVLGYKETRIIDSVCDALKKYKPEVAETLHKGLAPRLNNPHWELAEKLYDMSGGFKSLFTLSGSDAVEAAVKLAAAYHESNGSTRDKIVGLNDGYHGTTLLTLSIGSAEFDNPHYNMQRYQSVIRLDRDFEIDDIDWSDVMCFVIETCPHNANNTGYSNDFWQKVKTLQEQGVIIIIDDIFMGGGKTGKFFGWSDLPVTPDIFTMGKAITGGYFPLAIAMYNSKIDSIITDKFAWWHGHTYSFPLSGIVSMLEYLKIIEQEQILERHENIKSRAIRYFIENGYEIVGSYGLVFTLKHNDNYTPWVVPINANDEYFEVLPDTLTKLNKKD